MITEPLALFAILLGLAAQEPPEPAAPGEFIVQIRDPITPTFVVRTHAGACGRDRYSAELRGGSTSHRPLMLSLAVNGKAVARSEVQKVLSRLPSEVYIYDATVAECSRSSRQATIRLMTAGASTNGPLWKTFLLSVEGTVTLPEREWGR